MMKLLILPAALGAVLLAATPSFAIHNQQGLKACPAGTYNAPEPPKLFPNDPCDAGPKPVVKAAVVKKK